MAAIALQIQYLSLNDYNRDRHRRYYKTYPSLYRRPLGGIFTASDGGVT